MSIIDTFVAGGFSHGNKAYANNCEHLVITLYSITIWPGIPEKGNYTEPEKLRNFFSKKISRR